MFKGIGMNHEVQDSGGKGKGIKVSVDLLFGRIFDAWVIYHPRDLKTFIVDIFNWTLPLSHKRKSMVRVTFISISFKGIYMRNRVSSSRPRSRNPRIISFTVSSVHRNPLSHLSVEPHSLLSCTKC